MKPSVITVANEQVSIATVCRLLGVEVADESNQRAKLHCPFEQTYHSDQGISPAMRLYEDTNSVYCFSCSASNTPVSLYAQAMDLRYRDAAQQLLERVGYKPLDLAAVWQAAQVFEPTPDRTQLAEALKTFCRRVDPCWGTSQFEDRIAVTLTRCLATLDLVRDSEDAGLWLTRCKEIMRNAIDR